MSLYKDALRYYGISDTNGLLNRDMLLEGLSGGLKGYSEEDIKSIVQVLQDNPDRDKDKKAIMAKSGRESSINSTTGQGLGSVIDNMPYYVDSSAWWIKGWNPEKYSNNLKRSIKSNRRLYIDETKLNRNNEIITRRRRVARKVLKNKD